jgi:regulator of sigma E protease
MLLKEAVKHEPVAIEIQSSSGSVTARSLDLSGLTKDDLDRDFLGKLGLRSVRLPAEFGRILPGGAAERAGFKPGDRVLAISGRPITSWSEFLAEVAQSATKPLVFEIDRAGQRLEIKATPDRAPDDAKRGRLGVEAGDSVKREFERMTTTVRIKMLGRMIVGDVSWKNLSGPITIADYAGQSAQMGWITYLGFLALVSVSLGVLNLLPIPLLDGGHLVYYFAEIVMRRPVSERVMEIGQRFGLALLLGLTFFAFYNDLNRLFTG